MFCTDLIISVLIQWCVDVLISSTHRPYFPSSRFRTCVCIFMTLADRFPSGGEGVCDVGVDQSGFVPDGQCVIQSSTQDLRFLTLQHDAE